MSVLDGLTTLLLVAGTGFFLSGTLGLLRLPDLFSRLHALVKADNLGMGFIVAGLALQAESWAAVVVMGAVWVLMLLASVVNSHLIAHAALQEGFRPWVKEE